MTPGVVVIAILSIQFPVECGSERVELFSTWRCVWTRQISDDNAESKTICGFAVGGEEAARVVEERELLKKCRKKLWQVLYCGVRHSCRHTIRSEVVFLHAQQRNIIKLGLGPQVLAHPGSRSLPEGMAVFLHRHYPLNRDTYTLRQSEGRGKLSARINVCF